MPEITIIMPSYNVGRYIEECLESVTRQTFTDLEILCIDPGSTDGTLEILERFAAGDSRIQVIHSEKKSYGYQVNKGIELAKGRYIGIVETDDFIEPDMYETLYHIITENRVDFVKGGTMFCFDHGPGRRCERDRTGLELSLFSEDREQAIVEPGLCPDILWQDHHLWNGLYDSRLIKNIRLSETPGAAYQDTGFMFQMYTSASRGIFIKKPIYHYRRTNGEASAYDTASFGKLLYEYRQILEGIDEFGSRWQRALMIKLFIQIRVKFKLMGLQGRFWEEASEDMDRMREMISGTLSGPDFPENRREDAILFLDSPRTLYEKFRSIYSDRKKAVSDMVSTSSGSRVALFGAGPVCDFAETILRSHGIFPAYVCDNSDDKQGESTSCGEICRPEEAIEREQGLLFIITARSEKNRAAIRQQLLSLGVSGDDIFTYKAGIDSLLLLLGD